MRDLLVIVPSRGRPSAVRELHRAVKTTAQARTDLLVAYDDDDPQRHEYARLRSEAHADRRFLWVTGPRDTLAGWTNRMAHVYAGKYRALCSMGDDHRPRTHGWDTRLLAALNGTGFAYGNDLIQGKRLPTSWVVSSDIVQALGWMCEPSLRHYCVDNVVKELGERAGCLHYLADVVIEHLHYLRTGANPDATYRAAELRADADLTAYWSWLSDAADYDTGTIRSLLKVTAGA